MYSCVVFGKRKKEKWIYSWLLISKKNIINENKSYLNKQQKKAPIKLQSGMKLKTIKNK